MQGGHCTCLSKVVEVSGVYLHILTVVRKASEAFFVGQTHKCKRMFPSGPFLVSRTGDAG